MGLQRAAYGGCHTANPTLRQRLRSVRVKASSTVLITGGNTGIGYETAKVLCQKGYNVTIACRNPEKAAAATNKIKAALPGASISTLALDLADLSSVKAAANEWLDSGKELDVLVNNAGVMACPQMTTKDGFEYQLGINHIGHFLLTNLLLPKMQESNRPARIVNVSSAAHMFGQMHFDDIMLTGPGAYDPWKAYGQSKLANVLFTYELARRLQPSNKITVNCLHPGVVRTELSRYLIQDPDAPFSKILTLLFTPFTKSPKQGAETSIFLASSPDVEGVSSKYFDNCKPVATSKISYDLDTARKLWEVTEELIDPYL